MSRHSYPNGQSTVNKQFTTYRPIFGLNSLYYGIITYMLATNILDDVLSNDFLFGCIVSYSSVLWTFTRCVSSSKLLLHCGSKKGSHSRITASEERVYVPLEEGDALIISPVAFCCSSNIFCKCFPCSSIRNCKFLCSCCKQIYPSSQKTNI